MSTQVMLDDGLLEQARPLSPAKTIREVVDLALREFVDWRGPDSSSGHVSMDKPVDADAQRLEAFRLLDQRRVLRPKLGAEEIREARLEARRLR